MFVIVVNQETVIEKSDKLTMLDNLKKNMKI